ncbi:MAG: hypothetical protein HN366_04975 [Deltaproteobacteria bacterium]|jgi:hypothetical protein|nr:hypothetical protein [Deltaproteobacteria bacterium]
MKLQESKSLSTIYNREEAFSSDLANHLVALGVGSFEDAETESNVGTRKADIVAVGDDGVLVIENQFGRADWDHWGRLEAYARLKEANVAVLVAESFEELMIVTCNLRNEDSKTDWYLIQAQVNSHEELFFNHVARPAIDIQTERTGVEYSEFWEPIRRSGLFAGKPVPVRDEGWIGKGIKGISLLLQFHNHACSVLLSFQGEDRLDRRTKVLELFPETEWKYELRESPKFASIIFPVLDKGKKDRDHWPDIREKLTTIGEAVYSKIKESDI